MVDEVIVVYVDEQTQLDRLMKRNDLTIEEAKARMNAQISIEEKKQMTDYVIDNRGSLKETKHQLKQILKKLNVLS